MQQEEMEADREAAALELKAMDLAAPQKQIESQKLALKVLEEEKKEEEDEVIIELQKLLEMSAEDEDEVELRKLYMS